jgi:hypothetical protein
MYNGDGDLTALGTAIMNSNPQGISATEWAGVGAVGVGATLLVRNVLPVVAVGTAMYVLGYYVRGMRPEGGWYGK